jgi:hypothetical protein
MSVAGLQSSTSTCGERRTDCPCSCLGRVRTGLHFHDLRHTGNTLAAASGAKLRDLMARMGHDSERAALIYQHESRGADQVIAAAIDRQLRSEHGAKEDDDGGSGALDPVG